MHSGFTVGATWQPSFVDTAHTPAKASEGKQLAHSCYAVVSGAQNFVAATGIEPAMFCAANARSTTTPLRVGVTYGILLVCRTPDAMSNIWKQ